MPDSKATSTAPSRAGPKWWSEMSWRGTHSRAAGTADRTLAATTVPLTSVPARWFEMSEGKARVIALLRHGDGCSNRSASRSDDRRVRRGGQRGAALRRGSVRS